LKEVTWLRGVEISRLKVRDVDSRRLQGNSFNEKKVIMNSMSTAGFTHCPPSKDLSSLVKRLRQNNFPAEELSMTL